MFRGFFYTPDIMNITPKELDELLIRVNKTISRVHIELEAFAETAYKTGLRVNEILNIDRHIIDIDEERILIRTEKTNNIRTINANNVSRLIKERINIGVAPFMRITYSQLNLQLKKAGLYDITVNGNKRTTAHLYRHNYAKKQYEKYKSIAVVAEDLRITEAIAQKYINSKIVKGE